MIRIDANHHVWTIARGDYHWMSPDLAIARDYGLDDLRPLLGDISTTVLVQAADSEAELVVACAYAPMRGHELVAAQDQLGAEAYQVVGSAPAESTLRIARDRARAQGAEKVRTVAVEDEPVAGDLRQLLHGVAERGVLCETLGTVEREHQQRVIRQMERHTQDQAYFLFLYNPIELYAVNKAVDYVPYVHSVLDLHELSVTEQHWSIRKQKAAGPE